MNRVRLILLAFALAPLMGCESFKQWMIEQRQPPRETGNLPPRSAEKFVEFVNVRAAQTQTLSADVQVTAFQKGIRLPGTLNGSLTASQPRNFRMKVDSSAALADLGSNKDQFWVYFKGFGMDPLYVFAAHTDFEAGRAQLPPGITFEPDWVMQALGMLPLSAGGQYTVSPPDQKNRTYTLSWPAVVNETTSDGKPKTRNVVKEIVFDGDPTISLDPKAANNKPQIKKHIVRDPQGKVICSAEIKQVKTLKVENDTRLSIQYPTRVILKWEEPQKFEMDLELSKGQVNVPIAEADARVQFNRPVVDGVRPIDLAEARFPVK